MPCKERKKSVGVRDVVLSSAMQPSSSEDKVECPKQPKRSATVKQSGNVGVPDVVNRAAVAENSPEPTPKRQEKVSHSHSHSHSHSNSTTKRRGD